MNRLAGSLSSMAGRLFLILVLGMLAAAMTATWLADVRRRQEVASLGLTRTADRLQDVVELLDLASPELRERLLASGGPGIREAGPEVREGVPAPDLANELARRQGLLRSSRVSTMDAHDCLPPRMPELAPPRRPDRPLVGPDRPPAGPDRFAPASCRLVALTLRDGTPLRLAVVVPPDVRIGRPPVDPGFLSLLAVGIALLALLVARIASAPLSRLAAAAEALGRNLQGQPMSLGGPIEVRRAAQAFNAMQEQLQHHLAARTQMLAAITHDLQTPLTRLRLRLEDVGDEALRTRLVADLAAMQALIREGLDLARSAESAEQAVALDLDSLLESLVEDAVEAGRDVRFEQGTGAVLMLRPLAMQRLFANLLDNALTYGSRATIRSEAQADGALVVRVRDHGPGIPEADLQAVFDPFFRLEGSRSRETGGTGLGLTIARMLAQKEGAELTLRNVQGGLEAQVAWRSPTYAQV